MDMELEANAELLGRVPIFQGLTTGQLNAIANCGREVQFEQGSMMLTRGERGNAAYLILSGSVALQDAEHSPHSPELLGCGTFLGELAMLVETTFTLSMVTRWPARALCLKRAAMFELMEEDPSIAHHFSLKLLERLLTLAIDLRRLDGKFAMIEHSLDQTIADAGGGGL
jgi:CRP/FNR family transcriptional regulator, cyclic AMP receptor protein